MAHKGIPKLVAPVLFITILYTVQLCTCAKAYLQSNLLFPFKWENVPFIPA